MRSDTIFSPRIFTVAAAIVLVAIGNGGALFAAQAYALVDAQTGYVIEQQAGKDKRQIGSLTKIATAMVVLDWAESRGGDLNQLAAISPEALVGTGENRIGFQPGDTITLRDLLYATLVQSDNVAAYALASHVGLALERITPSLGVTPVAGFVAQMNALAKQLKMERTRYVNPHGIDEKVRPAPYSTALDQARLTRYAVRKASFRFYVSQKERQIVFRRGERQINYLLRNTNELLGRNGIDGGKTGRTARAGDCLILTAHRTAEVVKQGERARVTPRYLILVMLGSTNRFGEGEQLLARGWALYDQWAAAGRMVDPNTVL